MGSCEVELTTKKKAMWLYPKFLGHNPPERWGHSACFSHSHGLLYIFGGCCGGLHFSDVLTINLRTMSWAAFPTTGRGPGPRDSHTAVLVRNKMVVFGGTNGSHKVNDLHILDLASGEWSQPNCVGNAPSPRESHTATLLGEDKMVIFGGSGEGEGNYLNDLHVLDLVTMRWSLPANVAGDLPVPRDSHTAVAVMNRLIVYGGDRGDRYHGDVDIFDFDASTWSRLAVQGLSPGVRAGHASVTVGSKVYVIGGVGERRYYNDVWVLDTMSGSGSWTRLEVCGQQPQGRFSQAAVVTSGSEIAIYGGCGEDERPLNELLVLYLGTDNYRNGLYNNISMCKIFGNGDWSKDRTRYIRDRGDDVSELQSPRFSSDILHPKRRRMSSSRVWEVDSRQEEQSFSISSQHSSPSRSNQDQITIREPPESPNGIHGFQFFKRSPNNSPRVFCQPQEDFRGATAAAARLGSQKVQHRQMLQPIASDSINFQNLVGADVCGKVDGAFDSGLFMTAVVNGKIFRGVLFPPQPTAAGRPLPPACPVVVAQPVVKPSDQSPTQRVRRILASKEPPAKRRNDLQDVVLTLAGPGDKDT